MAEFNPVLFNYQSYDRDPAVLAILATREGTSITVIDNERDAFEAGGTWGQRLFFNQNGERASLTGQRKSDFVREAAGSVGASSSGTAATEREGLNMVLMIQVPLRQKEARRIWLCDTAVSDTGVLCCCRSEASDVEEAVIGHGKVEGLFTEIDGLQIERDDRYPIRVTVQFYKATSNGVVSEEDMSGIARQIHRVYEQADYVGSLVLDGPVGRSTEYSGPHVESPGWWHAFWGKHFQTTGQSREEAIELLRRLLGDKWTEKTEVEAEAAMKKHSATSNW
jgi:hypothetical protein